MSQVEIQNKQTNSRKSPIQEALNKYCQVMQANFSEQLERLILFGSQARGDARADSDIDVLVVVNWEMEQLPGGFYAAPYSDPRWQAIVELASDFCVDYGVYISPLIVSEKQFQTWSPLLQRIKEEGVELWTKKKDIY